MSLSYTCERILLYRHRAIDRINFHPNLTMASYQMKVGILVICACFLKSLSVFQQLKYRNPDDCFFKITGYKQICKIEV